VRQPFGFDTIRSVQQYEPEEYRMFLVRPVRPADARRILAASLRRFDDLTLETLTPAWSRPRAGR
jgi:hypothetical protein